MVGIDARLAVAGPNAFDIGKFIVSSDQVVSCVLTTAFCVYIYIQSLLLYGHIYRGSTNCAYLLVVCGLRTVLCGCACVCLVTVPDDEDDG